MKRFFRQNLGLKITALVLAALVWFLVTGEANRVRVGDIHVTYPGTEEDAGLALVAGREELVRVELTGPASAVNRGFERMTVVVDLRNATPGQRTVLLSEDNLQNMPAGCTARIDPSRLTLELDARVERQLDVQETSTGAPADGYEVVSIEMRPPSVLVSGPASAFEDEDLRVMSDPIDLRGLAADGTAQTHSLSVGAAPSRPEVRLLNPVDFRAVVEVREVRDRVTLEVPVTGLPDAVQVHPSATRVTAVVEGYPSKIQQLAEGLRAEVSSAELGGEWTRRSVTLSEDPAAYAAELLSLRPSAVRVRAPDSEDSTE